MLMLMLPGSAKVVPLDLWHPIMRSIKGETWSYPTRHNPPTTKGGITPMGVRGLHRGIMLTLAKPGSMSRVVSALHGVP